MTKHYKKLMRSFYKYFGKTVEHHGEEDLHQMRVCIKKLKAQWSLIAIICGEKWSKAEHYELFRNLFKSAGKFRETQVNQNMIQSNEYDGLEGFSEYLLKQKDHFKDLLISEMKQFDFELLRELNQKLENSLRNISDESIIEHAKNYIKRKFEKTQSLISLLPDDQSMHKIRIHLKAIVEILRITVKLTPDKELRQLRKRITIFNEELGDWHDHIVFMDTLNQYKSGSDIHKQSDKIKMIYPLIRKEIQRRQIVIESKLKDHLFQDSFKQIN